MIYQSLRHLYSIIIIFTQTINKSYLVGTMNKFIIHSRISDPLTGPVQPSISAASFSSVSGWRLFSDHWAYPTPDRSHPALKIFHFYCKYFSFIENIFDGSAVNSIGYISITEWSPDSSTPYGKSYFTNSYSILLQTQTEVVYKRSIFTSFIHKINLVIKILSYNCSYLKQRQ